jgi:hypothetical protein
MNIMIIILNYLYKIFVYIMDMLGRRRIIYDRVGDEPYLERYYIFLKDRRNFPFNIFLHRFLKSDPDDLHNHPWKWRTLILFGGYWEYTEQGKFWRAPFTYRCSQANTFHRIELDKNVPYCWTLFIPSLNVQDWGFKTKNGWVNHEQYFEMKKIQKELGELELKKIELDNELITLEIDKQITELGELNELINFEELELEKEKEFISSEIKELNDEEIEEQTEILTKKNI